MNLLVIGARNKSLGQAVCVTAAQDKGWSVITAGLHKEDVHLDVLTDDEQLDNLFRAYDFDAVVCTVGMNDPAGSGSLGEDFSPWMMRSFQVNTIGPMLCLQQYLLHRKNPGGQFVAVSSNSAHIARSNSMAYCASKAALSMSLRVAAREVSGYPVIIYGYELGLLRDTPMTKGTEARFGPSQTRMPGADRGLLVGDVAAQIVGTLGCPSPGLNGALIRLDAGEQ